MALGKCFICKETGHIARDCLNEDIKRSSSSEPSGLGISSFNIRLEELDGEDSDEVENLHTLRVSAMTICQDEISPEERNVPCEIHQGNIPETLAEHSTVFADRQSAPLNVHTSAVPEVTGVPLELGAQRAVVPCAACSIDNIDLRKDLEGARFDLADPKDPVYVICDDGTCGKKNYFAFRGPRQRKEGEGEPTAPQNIGLQSPQECLGFINDNPSLQTYENRSRFDAISLFSLFKLGFSYLVAFWYHLLLFFASFTRIFFTPHIPKIISIGLVDRSVDDFDNHNFVSEISTYAALGIVFPTEQQSRSIFEPNVSTLRLIAHDIAIANASVAGLPPESIAVSAPIAPTDENKFRTAVHRLHFPLTHATVENPNCHCTIHTIFAPGKSEDPTSIAPHPQTLPFPNWHTCHFSRFHHSRLHL